MARSKVILPPNSSGQNMGIVTYSNGTDTVGAAETTLVDAAGAQIGGDATNGLDVDVTRVVGITSKGQATKANSLPVTLASDEGAVLVQGTLTVDQGTSGDPWSVTTTTTYPEDSPHVGNDTGQFMLAVRKDTAASTATTDGDYTALVTDASGRLHVNVGALPTLPAGTNNIGDVDVLSLPALPAGTNNIGDVDILTVPTLTKGTQGSTGFSVQNLTDAGRTFLAFTVQNLTAGTSGSEAMASFSQNKGGSVTGSVTSYTVTSGKRLRLTGFQMAITAQAATVVRLLGNIRSNTGGATITSSALVAGFDIGGPAVSGQTAWMNMDLGEAIEILGDGTLTMGVSFVPTWTTTAAKVSITLLGYEY